MRKVRKREKGENEKATERGRRKREIECIGNKAKELAKSRARRFRLSVLYYRK